MNTTPKPNRRLSRRRPMAKQSLTGAARRDDAFGEPCRLWCLVAWYASTDPGEPRPVYQVSKRWSLYLNRSDRSCSVDPFDQHTGQRCGPGEAVAFFMGPDGRNRPVMRVTRNAVLAIDSVPFVEGLSDVLEQELRNRNAAAALVRTSRRSAAQ